MVVESVLAAVSAGGAGSFLQAVSDKKAVKRSVVGRILNFITSRFCKNSGQKWGFLKFENRIICRDAHLPKGSTFTA
jgi:hypothetical protein